MQVFTAGRRNSLTLLDDEQSISCSNIPFPILSSIPVSPLKNRTIKEAKEGKKGLAFYMGHKNDRKGERVGSISKTKILIKNAADWYTNRIIPKNCLLSNNKDKAWSFKKRIQKIKFHWRGTNPNNFFSFIKMRKRVNGGEGIDVYEDLSHKEVYPNDKFLV